MSLIDQYKDWQRRKTCVPGVFWQTLPDNQIKILQGPYTGIIVNLGEPEMVGEGLATFDYSIVNPSLQVKKGDKKFEEVVSDIFLTMLELAMESYGNIRDKSLKDASNDIEENGTDYFEEPYEKRVIHKKGSSTPEE